MKKKITYFLSIKFIILIAILLSVYLSRETSNDLSFQQWSINLFKKIIQRNHSNFNIEKNTEKEEDFFLIDDKDFDFSQENEKNISEYKNNNSLKKNQIKKKVKDYQYYQNQSLIFLEKEDYQEAFVFFDKANKLYNESKNNQKENKSSHLVLLKETANGYLQSKDLNKAKIIANQILNIDPSNVDGLKILAQIAEKEKNHDLADSLYKKIIRSQEDVLSLYKLGNATYKRGEINEAIRLYTRCLLTDPSFYKARFNRSKAYGKKEQWSRVYQDASLVYEIIQQKQDTKYILPSLRQMAISSYQLKRNSDAIKYYNQVLSF